MKRDMDIVRQILIASELEASQIEGSYPVPTVVSHVKLMEQAGLIHAASFPGSQLNSIPASYSLMGLTWEGHELLSAMRDDTLWAKAKKVVMEDGKSWTIEVLKAWLTVQAKEKLGLSAP